MHRCCQHRSALIKYYSYNEASKTDHLLSAIHHLLPANLHYLPIFQWSTLCSMQSKLHMLKLVRL